MADTTLLLRSDDIAKLSSISGTTDIDKLTPWIYSQQINQIRRILTVPLYDKILLDFENDTLAGDYLIIYENFVVDMLVYFSAATFISLAPYQITNGGVYKNVPENGETIDVSELNTIVSRYTALGNAVELIFNDFMKDANIPEYTKNCSSGGSSYGLNWYLE